MTTATAAPPDGPGDAGIDPDVFAALVARHRRALYAHCLRILSSPEQAEDALQEALLRAWRSRAGFAGRCSVRTWLYRIATNACLDELQRDGSRPRREQPARVVPLDDEAHLPNGATASTDPGPDVLAEARETLERAFVRVIALLPPRQRAALLLCEVLRCPAAEVAVLLDTSVAAVNSALQRARATLSGEQPTSRTDRPSGPADRALLDGYVDAVHRSDVRVVVALARADAAGATPSDAVTA
jgi:RNA polymerase sigma-70 factor (TIGR02960 family)